MRSFAAIRFGQELWALDRSDAGASPNRTGTSLRSAATGSQLPVPCRTRRSLQGRELSSEQAVHAHPYLIAFSRFTPVYCVLLLVFNGSWSEKKGAGSPATPKRTMAASSATAEVPDMAGF